MQQPDPHTRQKQFMLLYEPVHTQLSRYCRALVRHTDDARDLMGETVALAFEQFHTLRNPSQFKFYLFGIAGRLLKRKLRRKKFWAVFDSDVHGQMPDTGSDPSDEADIRILYDAIELLPGQQREILVLFELSGFSLNDIAEIKQMNLSTVKTNLSRARAKLSELLNPKENLNHLKLNAVKP